MNLRNNETIAGIVLLAIWIVIMIVWGHSKNIVIDQNSGGNYEPSGGYGHPLYKD